MNDSLKYLYEIHAVIGPDHIREALYDFKLRLQQAKSGKARRHYLDTFDWRVYRDGALLTVLEYNGDARLTWRELASGQIRYRHTVPGIPRFREALRGKYLAEHLGSIIEMRALYPRATVTCNVTQLKVLNREHKTVLHIDLERDFTATVDGKRTQLKQTRLEIIPVRGYGDTARKVGQLLENTLPASPASEDPILLVMRHSGQVPGDYTSKLKLALQPEQRADVTCKTILHRLLDTMTVNEPGVRNDIDSEFLHDYRVAVRRTRSLLGQVKHVFPRQQTDYYRREFAWLGQITTPTRDMDVYLLGFDQYRDSLPPALRDHLQPFEEFLKRHQKYEHGKLVESLDSLRYQRLKEKWQAYLESGVPRHTSLANAMRPAIEVANERIWHVYKRAMKEGKSIDNDTPAEALHELRKTCKKLRYLLEFFSSLYPAEKTSPLITALKALQDNLGSFQDYEVQQQSLSGFKQAMMEEMEISDKTREAMDLLVENLAKGQRHERKKFAKRFAAFSSTSVRKQFKSLFHHDATRENAAA